MIVVCINGAPGAGKDEFVKQCQKINPLVINISTVDFIKKIARECGWDGTKTPENRKFLSDLKFLLADWNDVPYKKVIEGLKVIKANSENAIVFIHVREPAEIFRFATEVGALTLIVRRKSAEDKVASNIADRDVLNYDYDYIVDNNGSIEALADQASMFLETIEGSERLILF